MSYTLASDSWGAAERAVIVEVLNSGRYTMGERVAEFERRFAEYVWSRNAVMVNSGSSANLVALAAMMYRGAYGIAPGSEVIVPAVSWSTTYSPVLQLGLKLVLVDVDLDTLNIDAGALASAITDKTSAVIAVNLLGSAEGIARVRNTCKKRGIVLMEDNCESLGAVSQCNLEIRYRQAGTFGACGTYSFFFSHHLQTMEGGMIVTDDDDLADYMRSIRAHGWVRDQRGTSLYTLTGNKFKDSFKFVLPGYCMRPLEMSGAVGSVQLEKLPAFLANRRTNAIHFLREIDDLRGSIRTQLCNVLDSSWFGFSMIFKDSLRGRRDEIVNALSAAGVESRPIVTGNFANQPVMKYYEQAGGRIHGSLRNAQEIDEHGLFIGNDHRDLKKDITRAISVIRSMS